MDDSSIIKRPLKKPSHSFKGAIYFWLSLFFGLSLLFGFNFFKTTNADRLRYTHLMQEANPTLIDKTKRTPYTASQKRSQIRKDLYYGVNQRPMHLLLTSHKALLQLNQKQQGSFGLIEEMEDVRGYMQEELFFVLPNGQKVQSLADPHEKAQAMQLVRYFSADKAIYCYQTKLFTSKDVHIAKYIAPGHTLDSDTLKDLKPIMQGTAAFVEFSLAGKDLNFKAEHFKAKFSKGEIL